MHDHSSTLSASASAGHDQAVLAEAERIVRAEQARELAKARRDALKQERQRLARDDRDRKAAEQDAEEERQREAARKVRAALLERIREAGAACGGSVMDRVFGAVPDPRDPRGVRYSMACILALVTMAMLAGNQTMAAVTCWIASADPVLLAAAGTRAAPCGKTVSRVLGLADPDAVDGAVSRYLADGERALQAGGPGQDPQEENGGEAGEEEEEEEGGDGDGPSLLPQVAADGKYVRGARLEDGTTLIQLAAATPAGTVLAQREIPSKTTEKTQLIPMLEELDGYYPLAGHVLTADAAHTFTDLPDLARRTGAAGCVLTVKDNQPTIRALLENALWARAAAHVTTDKGHGRAETRSHLVMNAPAEVRALFPPAEQVARVVRTRTVTGYENDGHTRTRTTRTSTEFAYLIITMTARQALPEHIAVYIRNHWGIENRVHYVRDVTLREDSSQVRTGSRPRVLTSLRNLNMGLIRQAGFTEIAATIRDASHDDDLLLAILRLEPAS